MTTRAAQLATLVSTARSLKATLDRINIVDSPRAWDLTSEARDETLQELRRALAFPLTAAELYRREVPLSGGRRAEVFNVSGAVCFAIRRENPAPGEPSTEVSHVKTAEHQAMALFREAVLADLGTY